MADVKIALVADALNQGVGGQGAIGDLYLQNGSPVLLTSLVDTVAQDLKIALSLFQGEWFLDPTQGIPYFQKILGKISLSIVSRIFQTAILSRPGIASIVSFSVTRSSNRSLVLNFSVRLINGAVLTSSSYGAFVVGV